MFPLRASAVLRYFIGLGLLLSPATFIRGADVELKAYWTKGREHWLVHIQPARSGIFIAPNSPVFANDQLIAVTDAVTRQLVPFRLRHSGERMLRSIDLAFPQLQKPMNLSLAIRGLLLVDQTGRRVGYNQNLAVRAPPAMAGESTPPRPTFTPRSYEYSSEREGRPAAPETTGPVGEGAPPPIPLNAPPVQPTPPIRGLASEPIGGGAAPLGSPINVGAGGREETQIPQFPFPPPMASAFDIVQRELLVGGKTNPKLKDVDAALSSAFVKCGYGEKSFYAVPDGFAMASRLEQINADGSFGANRWSLATAPLRSFSIESYLGALFRARAGHFRVVVFMVTNHSFEQTDAKVSSDQAISWVKKGLNQLPKKIGDRNYTDDYVCTALIYEFKTLGGGQASFVEPSEITGHIHLEKSGLLAALSRPR